MATKNQTNSLALVEAPVPDILSKLEEEIKKLNHISDTVYKTTGNLEGFGDIKKETLVGNLIRAFSIVLAKETAYNKAAEELGLSTYPAFEISGGNAEAWKQDITLRIAIIEHKDRLDKLKSAKEKISKFLSIEDQKAIALKEIAAMFN
jgi:hypothetical protein